MANEVRKMATTSRDNVARINDTLKTIRNLISNLEQSLVLINETSDGQAAAIQQISASMQEISCNTQQLTKMYEDVLNHNHL